MKMLKGGMLLRSVLTGMALPFEYVAATACHCLRGVFRASNPSHSGGNGMYSVVLMAALTAGTTTPSWGSGCHGCSGGWGGCHGCHGLFAGRGCHGCHGWAGR